MTAPINPALKKRANWVNPRSYFACEPPTLAEAIVLQTLKSLCDDGDGKIADCMAEAFLRAAPDQHAARRRAYALLKLAAL